MILKISLNVSGKNNKKYKFFSVQIKKEIVKIDKEGNMTVEIIS